MRFLHQKPPSAPPCDHRNGFVVHVELLGRQCKKHHPQADHFPREPPSSRHLNQRLCLALGSPEYIQALTYTQLSTPPLPRLLLALSIPFSPSLRLMRTSTLPPVYSFPGVVRGAAMPRGDQPQASSTAENSHLVRPRHVSSPPQTLLQSPLRHHRRTTSVGRPPIRETLNACVTYDEEEDGVQGVRINQYVPNSPVRI